MNSFYTNCSVYGSNILLKEIDEHGVKRHHKIKWSPTIYVTDRSETDSEWKTLKGEPVRSVKPGSIKETRDFIKQYSDVSGFDIYGQLNYTLQFMGERYPWDIEPDSSKISMWSIDIETRVGDSFPDPSSTACEVVLITVQNMNTEQCYTFGCKPYSGDDTKYILCTDEANLLHMFLKFWRQIDPDIVTGWNIETFDIPYLANRIELVLGEGESGMLGPWDICRIEKLFVKGTEEVKCTIPGLAILDYLALYKKFTYDPRESYSLGFISQEELGHTKVELPGKDFNDSIDNHWDIFTAYNVVDVKLVTDLDKKLKLIDVALALAYMAKINYDDVFSPVKLWDSMITNTLLRKKITVPQRASVVNRSIEGGYVKEPITGLHGWTVSLDATSLYPSIMRSLNISPDTVLGKIELGVDELLRRDPESEERVSTLAGFDNAAISAIGMMFDRSKEGFLGKIIADLMSERKSTKNKMLQATAEYEQTKNPVLQSKIASLNAKQMAIKILLNSLFGAYAQEGFRFFNPDVAESITLTGQYILRSIERDIDIALNKRFKTTDVKYMIAGDTDSCYFCLDPVATKFLSGKPESIIVKSLEKIAVDILQEEINNICNRISDQLNFFDNKISFKLEAVADKSLFLARKKYAMRVHSSEGVTYVKPKIKTVGLELVRSSTPAFIRAKLKESLGLIFNTDEKTVQGYIKSVRDEFMGLPVDAIAFPRGANNLKEYSDSTTIYKKGCPIQVRGVLMYNHYIKVNKLTGKYPLIREGSKIKFFYLKMPNPFKENVLAIPADSHLPPEFNLQGYVDYNVQFEKSFVSGLDIMLAPIGWHSEEKSSLDSFFG